MKPTKNTPEKSGNGGDKQQEMPKCEFEYETPHEQPREKGSKMPRT